MSQVSKQHRINQALRRYKRFRLHDADCIEEYTMPAFDVAMLVGTVDALEYTTERGEKVRLELEPYRHGFKRKARPKLCVTADGKNFFSLGGRFRFTERGFVDHK